MFWEVTRAQIDDDVSNLQLVPARASKAARMFAFKLDDRDYSD